MAISIQLVRGSSYIDVQGAQQFLKGVVYGLEDAAAKRLLAMHENGVPYFRRAEDMPASVAPAVASAKSKALQKLEAKRAASKVVAVEPKKLNLGGDPDITGTSTEPLPEGQLTTDEDTGAGDPPVTSDEDDTEGGAEV